MNNTILEPGPFDALGKAHDNEPIFPLLGRDHAAPGAITEWCRLRRNNAIKNFVGGSAELVEELRQCADAEAIALQMQAYRLGEPDEDQIKAERIGHNGVMGESQEVRDRNRQIAAAVQHLRDAASNVNEAGELLAQLGIDALAIHKANDKAGLPVFDLSDALVAIREADNAIAPKRNNVQPSLDLPEPIAPSFETDSMSEAAFEQAALCQHDWQQSPHSANVERCSKCEASRAWSKPVSEIRA